MRPTPLEQVKSLATSQHLPYRPQPGLPPSPRMPHIIRKPGFLGGTTLAVFMTLVHTVNDAITAILGACSQLFRCGSMRVTRRSP